MFMLQGEPQAHEDCKISRRAMTKKAMAKFRGWVSKQNQVLPAIKREKM
jgi:hypothetical protein